MGMVVGTAVKVGVNRREGGWHGDLVVGGCGVEDCGLPFSPERTYPLNTGEPRPGESGAGVPGYDFNRREGGTWRGTEELKTVGQALLA